MLTDVWRDILAVAGLLLTAGGFVYTIIQVRKAKSAAEAAQEAAKGTLAESQLNFKRWVAANARFLFNEAMSHVDRREWSMASVRINDVADQVAQLASLDPGWQRFAEELREWAATFRRLRRKLKGAPRKWIAFTVELQTRIDSCHGPFRGPTQEVTNGPAGQIP